MGARMKSYVFISYIAICLIDLSTAEHIGYYWKDYYGIIPTDAFPGGTDAGGKPTYIGQTYFPSRNIVIPTIIQEGSKLAYTATENKKYESDKNTKILCSDDHSKLRWITTSTSKLRFLTNCQQIYGGTWDGALITIGRANHLGRTITGMVTDSGKHRWYGLWIFDFQYQTINLQDFEILTYGCSENPVVS